MANRRDGRSFLGLYGHVNIDWVVDATVDPPKEEGPYFGGVAGNIAIGAARFGVPVALASVVGKDFPDGYRDLLQGLGVDISHLESVDGVETSRCRLITRADGRQEKDMFNGPYTDDVRLSADFVHGLEYVHISTGFPHPCVWAARVAFSAGCRVAFDPSADLIRYYDKMFLLSVLKYSDIVFFNQEEAETAIRLLGLSEAKDLLRFVDIAIITMGEDGSRLLTRDEDHDIPSFRPTKVVDPTGAGDAYRAGFYAGLYHGYGPRDACVLGAITASKCVTEMGAQHGVGTWDGLVASFEELGL